MLGEVLRDWQIGAALRYQTTMIPVPLSNNGLFTQLARGSANNPAVWGGGGRLDTRSDVFSFAVVLYQMLAGRRPFEGATDLEILQTIIHGLLQPLGDEIPAAVRAVVQKQRRTPAFQ